MNEKTLVRYYDAEKTVSLTACSAAGMETGMSNTETTARPKQIFS